LKSDVDSMAKKTLLRAVLKTAPMRSEFAKLAEYDEIQRSSEIIKGELVDAWVYPTDDEPEMLEAPEGAEA